MKKILALVFVLCMITACKQTGPVVNEVVDTPQPVQPIEEVTLIEKSADAVNVENLELLGHYTAEIEGIENEAEIELYTSAQRDRTGELMWDDSQEWLLIVSTDNATYKLYDQRINGQAYMKVLNSYNEDSDDVVINLHIYSNTFNEIREYRFNGEAFEERIRYTTDETSVHGISELYSSIPQYE